MEYVKKLKTLSATLLSYNSNNLAVYNFNMVLESGNIGWLAEKSLFTSHNKVRAIVIDDNIVFSDGITILTLSGMRTELLEYAKNKQHIYILDMLTENEYEIALESAL